MGKDAFISGWEETGYTARKRPRDVDGSGVFPEDVDDRERVPGHPLLHATDRIFEALGVIEHVGQQR